jgi:hypothetical protein
MMSQGLLIRIGVAIVCSWLGLAATAMADDGTASRFYFDDGFHGQGTLEFEFARPVETMYPDGTPVAADQPRFPEEANLASGCVIEQVRVTPHIVRMLASGKGADGDTPLMVILDRMSGYLDVFSVAGEELMLAERTGIGRQRTYIMVNGELDVMRAAYFPRRFDPLAGAICHGAIVLFCVVYEREDLGDGEYWWWPKGIAFVISQDQGVNWDLVYEEPTIDFHWPRGREWSMQNWWPLDRHESPTESYFVATDYRYNAGSPGGRVYMFRATRPTPEYDTWTIEPVVIPYERHGGPSGEEGEHFHSAGLVPYGENGMRLNVLIGDGQYFNRIASVTREDRDYQDLAGWTVQEDYNGSRGLPDGADPGIIGNQAVGCAPGPNAGDMIIGSDLNDEQLAVMRRDDGTAPSAPMTEHLYGWSWAGATRRSENFIVRTPTPELGGPYYALYSPQTNFAVDGSRRVLYSPDGERWVQATSVVNGNESGSVHGGHIYMDCWLNREGIQRFPIPTVLTRRPLHVASGGLQRGRNNTTVIQDLWGAIYGLGKKDGQWVYDNVIIDPQPPSTGRVYRVIASRFDGGTSVGRIRPAGEVRTVGDVLNTDFVQIRAWVMNDNPQAMIHPRVEVRQNGPGVFGAMRPKSAVTGTWVPIVFTGPADFWDTVSWGLWFFSGEGAPDDLEMFVALDCVIEGIGYPGYPMGQDESVDKLGTHFPDELAKVTGFTCEDEWTITLAGQIPEDGWDSSIDTIDEWPLATIWGDESNYIELVAVTEPAEMGRLEARVVSEGEQVGYFVSDICYWLRGSSLLVSIAQEPEGLVVSVAPATGNVHEARPSEELRISLAVPPSEIRFSSHHHTTSDGHEIRVTPMRWWGGEVRESEALPTKNRQELLASLEFLMPWSDVPGDLNGDGCVGISDLGILLASFEVDDGGDIDGDGDTDISDLGVLLAAFDPDC